jgi:hypothetical protein
MKIPFSLKLGNLFFVTVFMSFFFAVLYWKLFKIGFMSSLYKSISIQTIGGDPLIPKTDTEKAIISLQCMIAYMMVSGIIIVSVGLSY